MWEQIYHSRGRPSSQARPSVMSGSGRTSALQVSRESLFLPAHPIEIRKNHDIQDAYLKHKYKIDSIGSSGVTQAHLDQINMRSQLIEAYRNT